MMNYANCTLAFLLAIGGLSVADEKPFSASAALRETKPGELLLSVSFSIQDRHFLYADQIEIKPVGNIQLEPRTIPQAVRKYDKATGKDVAVYERDVTFTYGVKRDTGNTIDIKVSYQGCSDTICFRPVSEAFSLELGGDVRVVAPSGDKAGAAVTGLPDDWRAWRRHFAEGGRTTGYLGADKFAQFLDAAGSGQAFGSDRIRNLFLQGNAWLGLILTLLGGLALNLTPCVLPMIPINIAIIGAGAVSGARARGFALGGAYGMGMATVYGILGLVAALTSSTFGALSVSPVFNLVAAGVFVLLALGMFDVFSIDFSRFQGGTGPRRSERGKMPTAFVMGSFAALLAGACVAPVLISVLLLSADFHAKGNPLGLVLPFLLGVGMALPWPFIGAGLSFLPKPGRWMTRVKQVFGVIILGFACYYGLLAYRLFAGKSKAQVETAGWRTLLAPAMEEARKEGKPVFIDFVSEGCKSCAAMEATTLRNEAVAKRLEGYVKMKFNAGNLKDPAIMAVLDDFGIKGFPTYVVLVPGKTRPESPDAGTGK